MVHGIMCPGSCLRLGPARSVLYFLDGVADFILYRPLRLEAKPALLGSSDGEIHDEGESGQDQPLNELTDVE